MRGCGALAIRDESSGTVLSVKVVPGASRDRVAGVLGDAVKVVTSAAPEKGKANAAVAAILAEALHVRLRAVTLAAGATRARKEYRVAGLSAEEVRRRLAALQP
jgi:uncharacterized protein YggU (UPF0235/DUF167 family)